MSESEYELGQEGSDEDYEHSSQRRPGLRPIKRKR